MKRRTYLSRLGILSAAGGLTVGSGAFSSVRAERTVTVETADDDEALLALDDIGPGRRSFESSSDTVELRFPSFYEESQKRNFDLGLGTDSVYEFDRDADATTDGLIGITNRGTQQVKVYSEHQTDSELDIELYDVTDAERTALRDDPPELTVGESVDVGFRIRTTDAEVGSFNETLTIVAEA
jgi:hypothetical protein